MRPSLVALFALVAATCAYACSSSNDDASAPSATPGVGEGGSTASGTGGSAGSAKGGSAGAPSGGKGGTSTSGSGGAKAGSGGAAAGGKGGSASGGKSGSGGSSAGGSAQAGSSGQSSGGAAGTGGSESAGTGGAPSAGAGGSNAGTSGWTLSWSDEFDGPNGSPPDPSKWGYDVGGNGWGNMQLEYDTDTTANSYQQNGELVIVSRSDDAAQYQCWYGTCQYTSAHLNTKGKFTQTYGRFEVKMKIPKGQGMWPAFWLLGDDIDQNGWPTCGEIDVMENIGKEPATVYGSMHGPGYTGGSGVGSAFMLPGSPALGDDYHVYAIEWEPDVLRWYLDDDLYETRTPSDIPGNPWEFDHPFFLILNNAIGGGWPGNPDGTTVFPQEMRVDYVRAYTK